MASMFGKCVSLMMLTTLGKRKDTWSKIWLVGRLLHTVMFFSAKNQSAACAECVFRLICCSVAIAKLQRKKK